MATINHAPRLQLGDAPLAGYPGSDTDQVVVLWQTLGALSEDNFSVQYRANDSMQWLDGGAVESFATGVGSRVMHEAEIDGLSFDSTYEYRVIHSRENGETDIYAADFNTRLAAGDDTSFTFAAYGDSADPDRIAPFNDVQSAIARSDANFALLLGDNVYDDGRHFEFDVRFETGNAADTTLDWIASHIDYAAYGNHEERSGGQAHLDNYASPIPNAGIDAPAQPMGSRPELNYAFDYGDAHFVTFDTTVLDDPQALDALLDYVEADLRASDAQWKIVFAHHPLAGAPDKPESPADDYFQQVVPRLNAAGADLFLSGHSHTFGWTFPLTGVSGDEATFVEDADKSYAQGDGLIQVIAGTGGRSIRAGAFDDEFIAAGYTTTTAPAADYGFAQIKVSQTSLEVDYVLSGSGAVLDGFEIVKEGSDDGSGSAGSGTPSRSDYAVVIEGTSGNDRLTGTNTNEWIDARGGNDIIRAGGGDDYIIAGTGLDYTVSGGAGADIFQIGAGDGTIKISDFADGQDRLLLADGLTLDDFTISSWTGGGVTTTNLRGADGLRVILTGIAENQISAADIFSSDGDGGGTGVGSDDVPNPADFDQVLTGTDGRDRLVGTDGSDYIDAGDGNDYIRGGAGDDFITAGRGDDYNVAGGAGEDIFEFSRGDGALKILDFETGTDALLLSDLALSDFRITAWTSGAGVTTTSLRGEAGDRIIFVDVTADQVTAELLLA